jgi:uncharacterized protein YbjT (DUF2867 family)
MDVLVAGGHGKIALRLLRLLAADGHRARGLVRKPGQAADLEALGAVAVLGDLEADASLDEYVQGADAVVFAALAVGVQRYVMISSIGAHRPDAASGSMRPYLEAKAEADRYLIASGLEYTIIRPGSLTDDPGTGRVRVSTELGDRGRVPRDDVAAVIAEVLDAPNTIGVTFELFGGELPLAEAVRSLDR